jgi:hypothetical protein
MRLHKKTRTKRLKSSSPRARKSRRSNIFDGFKGSLGTGAVVVAVISVVAVAMLLASHGTSETSDAAVVATDAQAEMATPVKNVAATSGPARRATADAPAETPEPDASADTTTAKRSPITIAGCLERADAAAFRLTDTAGADAPKSRSWKSGWMRKGSAAVQLTDPTHGMRLANHVGQRVSVTGMLNERQMEVWSLRRVSATCG